MIISRFLYALVRLTALLGLLALASTSHAQARQQTLLVLGDSISAAYGMSLAEGWVALMSRSLAATHPQYQVINASISGETTGGGLLRLPALLLKHQPQLVLIELGGNDGLRGHPIAGLRSNLEALVTMSQEADSTVLLLPMEMPPNYGKRYTTSFRSAYKTAAKNTVATLGPFILQDIATDSKLMQADQIHPTAAAQQLIADQVLLALAPLLVSRQQEATL